MKNLFIAFIILLSVSFAAFAQGIQQKPITQAEYVRMLYQLERNPNTKQELIAAIRIRGIDFKLTSGLRSLTRSKGRNDAELKNTVEEANRRRENPEAAKVPTAAEATAILEKTRKNTLLAIEEMPDFVVKQLLRRSVAYANTNRWKSLDRAIIGVSYSTTRGEQYRVLSVDGVIVNGKKADNYHGLNGGSTTTGEFVKILEKIFDPKSETEFRVIDTSLERKRNALIYEFEIDINKYENGITYGSLNPISTRTGLKGKVWIDREMFRVLKLEATNTDIPAGFPVTALTKKIRYNWVDITEQKYLLPTYSEAIFTSNFQRKSVQSKNAIRFKDYQKFGTEVVITDDDDEVIIDDDDTLVVPKQEPPKEKPKEVEPIN